MWAGVPFAGTGWMKRETGFRRPGSGAVMRGDDAGMTATLGRAYVYGSEWTG